MSAGSPCQLQWRFKSPHRCPGYVCLARRLSFGGSVSTFATLNDKQLEVLSRVRDGVSVDDYAGFAHRMVARALHNQTLVPGVDLYNTYMLGLVIVTQTVDLLITNRDYIYLRANRDVCSCQGQSTMCQAHRSVPGIPKLSYWKPNFRSGLTPRLACSKYAQSVTQKSL